jgi:antitoxin (DNA-binding transcriptional repressor) of toxin-antitoxin stability system
MKTLSVTEGRQNLGAWLRLALRGEDVGFLVDGRIVALRPVEVYSDDYALQEYGVSEKQAERAYRTVKDEVRRARRSGQAKSFTGKL